MTEATCLAKDKPRIDDRVLGRAELLGDGDKELLEAVFLRGQSAASVARMMRARPRAIQAKVRRLVRRVMSRSFMDAARALPFLSPPDAALAKMRYCQGGKYQDLCRRLDLTLHQVRRNLDRLSAQIETIARISRPAQTSRPQGRDTA